MLDTTKVLASRLGRRAFVFPLATLAALAMLLISESAYWRASASMDGLGAMAQARSSLQELHRLVLDAETGQRGYLLTARAEYLTPYREAQEEVHATLGRLHGYFDTLPDKAPAMRDLEELVQAKLSELDTTLRLFDEGRVDAFRKSSQTLLADETRRVDEERRGIYQVLAQSRVGVGTMTALALLALFLYLRQTQALDAQREALRQVTLAERDHLEAEVRRRTAQLRELAQHLQTAREDERSRLARELHDELGALLTAAKLDAARLRSRIAGAGPEALERLAHLGQTLDSGIALKRRIIEDLRPSALSNLGLVAALDILTREHATNSGVAVKARLAEVPLDPAAELTVYRLVQEALTNASKHARARSIDVRLALEGGQVHVDVDDDGAGFDPAGATPGSHGLTGMRHRVEALGGDLAIDSAPGRGTRIRARLPVAAAAR
jgi:signal transduction histidine kinase